MRFKTGMVLGFGAGYLMGARAGRYRYEQIMKGIKGMWSSPEMEKFRDSATKVAEQVQEQAADALDAIRDKKVNLDGDLLAERVEPFVTAGHAPTGGALPHDEPL